jgi:Zn-finger nucleic acid-binding protein
MEKRPLSSRYTKLRVDICRKCDSVWLDGGELAAAQLIFEASTRGQEALEYGQRMKQLEADPARKQALEESMARLPDEKQHDAEDYQGEILDDILWLIMKVRTRVH